MAELKDEELLYSVEFVHNVAGRGLTALCCFPDPEKVVVRGGDGIEFVRSDKSIFRTQVKAISGVHSKPGSSGLIGFVLPDGVERDDIPYGSFLRLLERTSESK
jgi:hypothetical protein